MRVRITTRSDGDAFFNKTGTVIGQEGATWLIKMDLSQRVIPFSRWDFDVLPVPQIRLMFTTTAFSARNLKV
jgi:hypothetical protein